MVARAEALLRELGCRYRVLDLCTGDIGDSSARTFDLEVYSPGVDRWLEVSLGQLVHATTRPAGPTSATGPPGVGRRVRAHAQRLGAGLGPHLGRPGGDRAPGRRLGACCPRCWPPTSAGSCCSRRHDGRRRRGNRL